MKTKEELNAIKEEVQALSTDEMAQVAGGRIIIKDKEGFTDASPTADEIISELRS